MVDSAMGRDSNWMQTYTGGQFWPFQPLAVEVCIEDIAHSLAYQCRFNGHSRVFYSVAQHSVHVSQLCPADDALWGLMHDAAEAYVGDIIRPIKLLIPEFSQLEDRVIQVIVRRFGMNPGEPPSVKRADNIALATEARDVMSPAPATWGLAEEPDEKRIHPLGADAAEALFLQRFKELHREMRGS